MEVCETVNLLPRDIFTTLELIIFLKLLRILIVLQQATFSSYVL